jgi:glutathione synthase/RimK-type ligase-like ATP-grasp enzyme
MQKKISLLCTETGLVSKSLREIAKGLSTKLGYKVWRTTKVQPKRKQFKYGDLKDKISQYQFFKQKQLSALDFCQSIDEAKAWASKGYTVVCRTLTNASEGKGIVIAETPEQVVQAPVYTKYLKKKREFRVHIFKDTVVSVVEKLRRKEWEGQQDTKIRNTANGYVFCTLKTPAPQGINELAIAASKVTASDFKGVDVGYNEKQNQLFIIEVNSAPGIEGSNITKYVEEIVKYV